MTTARRLRLPGEMQQSVYHSSEWWNGGGAPAGLAGEDIPRGARLAALSSIACCSTPSAGSSRRSTPWAGARAAFWTRKIADRFVRHGEALLGEINARNPHDLVLEAEPNPVMSVPERLLAEVCSRVRRRRRPQDPLHMVTRGGWPTLARNAGQRLGLDSADVADLEVAGLLHDVGRVAISNTVWEKPDPLSAHEWEQARLHAYHSERILAGSERLAPLARLVGTHHERCDGSGYHRG